MKLLIDYGAYDDPPVHLESWSHSLHNHQDDPLVAAVVSGDIDKLEILRSHANLSLSDRHLGPSLLRCAIQLGSSTEMMKMLLGSGLDLSGKDGLESLKHAARMSSLPMARQLLDLGAPVNASDARQSISPLHIAADPNYHTDVAIVKLLIDHGAQVNAMSFTGQTPLHCTARRCDVAVARVLLENGADVNIQTDYDKTALHIAAELNGADLIKLLLSCGATVPSEANGLPPIRLAADNPIAQMLLAHDPNAHFRE
ncbi:uncharacterized protein PFLUO_LOCUS8049 [Penicillium psychrofluorescens]|uniref:uncharacterized protein n=1 Tax=Penicillium psychrofluorescens TaxID=3158075 RepID=UPI003CCE4CC1